MKLFDLNNWTQKVVTCHIKNNLEQVKLSIRFPISHSVRSRRRTHIIWSAPAGQQLSLAGLRIINKL